MSGDGEQRRAWTASRTLWTRLEPRTRDTSLDRVLRAEVHDPAWMLCRQWQVGEFQGEDAGSPVDAHLTWERDDLSRFRLGQAPGAEQGPEERETPMGPGVTPDPSMDEEVSELEAILSALRNHQEAQRQGSGDAQPAVDALDTYLGHLVMRSGPPPSVELHYLTASLLPAPDGSGTVTFFERANHYLTQQPTSEVTVAGFELREFVNNLESYANGTSGGPLVSMFERLLRAGNATSTGHLASVFEFGLDAASAYRQREQEETDASPPKAYDGEPLEALVEREAVAAGLDSDERPPARLRAEAGQQFLRFLADAGYDDGDDPYTAADFLDGDPNDNPFVLSEPDEPLDAAERRFAMVTDGRALDGHEVYRALAAALPDVQSSDQVPLPEGRLAEEPYETAADRYVEWYADLYDEPASDEADAWSPDRLEYRFEVATGGSDTETVFAANEYPGGRLDWYSFTTRPDGTLDPPPEDDLSTEHDKHLVPSHVRYPGMPVPRWWEFEDAEVHLDDIPAGPEELSKLLLLDFSLVHSNDWYLIPLELPVGSMTRITDLTVTDSFGEETTIDAVDDRNWNTFMFRGLSTDEDGEAGLFLPPILGDSLESDPVERVYFSRDEMANMAFTVEERVESYVGDPLEREEFHEPTLDIASLNAGPSADVESVKLHNPGSAPLDLEGWEVHAVHETDDGPAEVELHTFGAIEVPPETSVTLYTGSQPGGDTDTDLDVYAGVADTFWGTGGGSVTVLRDGAGSEKERFVTTETVFRPEESLPDYRLATSVPDHWFPLQPRRPRSKSPTTDTYRLVLSLLLDADSMDDPLPRIPRPEGRILNTPEQLRIYEEEVPRSGREVERHYQLARWIDGSTHLWSGRRTSTGRGEAASRLRYDVLSEPDEE